MWLIGANWNTFAGHFGSKYQIKLQQLPQGTVMNMTYFKCFRYLQTSKLDTLHICKIFGKWNLLQFEYIKFDFPYHKTLQMNYI